MAPDALTTLAERYATVQSDIAAAAAEAGRDPTSITTIVVTKFHPAALVRELAAIGAHDLGENRHQEAAAKAAETADLGLTWHFIGQLQSNKAVAVLDYASVIHSVDRASLVDALARAERDVDVFLQLNLTADPNRGGVAPTQLESLAERVRIAEHQLLPQVLADYVGRERDPEWIVAKVSELALALPETRFRTSHGAPAWRVGSESSGKFFAIMWLRHHGEESVAVLVKCSGQDELAALVDADPEHYFRPAYYGPSDWIGLRLDCGAVDWDHVAEWLAKSWQIVAPARLGKLMRVADAF